MTLLGRRLCSSSDRYIIDRSRLPKQYGVKARQLAAMSDVPVIAPKRRKVEGSDLHSLYTDWVATEGSGIWHNIGASYKAPGLLLTCHTFRVPLDHSGQVPGEIDLFVREVVSANQAKRGLPYLLYLQGGPGFEAPRPTEASAWLKSSVNSFRVVLLDQRGTGLSSPVTVQNLAKKGSASEQAKHLTYFRVCCRYDDQPPALPGVFARLLLNLNWLPLQSFGGFCATTYLSIAPQGLAEVMTAGGIPPNVFEPCCAVAVYRALYQRVLVQNEKYYARFPEDVAQVHRIVDHLASQNDGGALLPSGTLLTPRAFQMLGLTGLGSGGGFERLHYLLESCFDGEDINPAFIKQFESWMSWDVNPLYALLHESIYCQGEASNWAAHRVREAEFKEHFDATAAVSAGRPVMFTGEMVFPWMFDDFAQLRPYKAAADIVANKADWGPLYDCLVLQQNKVPVAAVIYVEDMYVDFNLTQNTAQRINGLRAWITNEFKHSGIRDDGARIFDRLLNMVRDTILIE